MKLSEVVGRGLSSAKPTSPAEGMLYYSTDLGKLQRYSGSEWEDVSLEGGMTLTDYDSNDDGTVDAADAVPWSGVTDKPSVFTPDTHTHTESDITDLDSYADATHTHTESDITDLGSYAVIGHAHTESDITDLGNYADETHTHTESDISDLDHTDADAIHGNVAGEISAVAEKATPVDADVVLIEDSEATWAKKRVALSALLGGSSVSALNDLTDVDAAAPDDGDGLVWDYASSKWVPGTVSIGVLEIQVFS